MRIVILRPRFAVMLLARRRPRIFWLGAMPKRSAGMLPSLEHACAALRHGTRRFAAMLLVAYLSMQAGCVVPAAPAPSGSASDIEPDTSLVDSPPADLPVDLAELATMAGGGAADLNALQVGDQITFSVPIRTSPTARVAQSACACSWTVAPVTAGAFTPANGCVTIYTVQQAGAAVISVRQTCDGQPTLQLSHAVNAHNPAAGGSNVAPVASVGLALRVETGMTVLLDGTSSFDPDGDSINFEWAQIGGRAVALTGANSAIATFVAPEADGTEILTFRLTVSDGRLSDQAELRVEIVGVEAAGIVTADAGLDQTVVEGQTVTLDGSESFGSGLGDLTFLWRQIAGPPVGLEESHQPVVTFTAPDVSPSGDLLIFELTVTEGNETDADVVAVTVVEFLPLGDDPTEGDGVDDPDGEQDSDDDGGVDDGPGGGGGGSDDPPSGNLSLIRAVYGGSNVAQMLGDGGPADMLLEDGLEHFAIKLNSLRVPVGGGTLFALQQWSQKLSESGAKLWVFFNWFSVLEHSWLLPLLEPYVGPDGVEVPLKPCPQSQDFWDRAITARFTAVAELTVPTHPDYIPELATALHAIMLDPELYAFNERTYRDPCFCDGCFQAFFNLMGITDPVPPPDQRLAYLQDNSTPQNDLVQAYEDYEQVTVRSRAAACRAALRDVNPDIAIGGTNLVRFDRSPFYVGLALGFGTAERPYYDWTQLTFTTGYNDALPALIEEVQSAGVHAVILPGLLMPRFPPPALADHYYTLAVETGGVWIDRSDNYGPELNFLCHPLGDYRQNIFAANAALDDYELDPSQAGPYSGAPFVPACLDLAPYDISGQLIPFEDGPPLDVGPLIRRETAYYFHADAGELLSFDVAMTEFGTNDTGSGWWILRAPDGGIMDSAPLTEALSPSLIRDTATTTGIHALIVNTSFVHGFRITNPSHPGSYRVILGNQRLGLFKAHLLQPEPQFYAYVPPGVTSVGLYLSASIGEASEVLIHDVRDQANPLFQQLIAGTVETTLTLGLGNDPASDGAVIQFSIRNPIVGGAEDLNITLTSGALPYLSQTRSGLFRNP